MITGYVLLILNAAAYTWWCVFITHAETMFSLILYTVLGLLAILGIRSTLYGMRLRKDLKFVESCSAKTNNGEELSDEDIARVMQLRDQYIKENEPSCTMKLLKQFVPQLLKSVLSFFRQKLSRPY